MSDPEQLELSLPGEFHPQRFAASRKGMVSTAHFSATRVGAEILQAGGNAIDAAVGAAFALTVCEPAASGLGGQTMMLIHTAEPRQTVALDGSSRAPNRATAEDFVQKKRQLRGHTASTVPSTPAALGYALSRYGTFSLARVIEPAIQLALEGFPFTRLQHKLSLRELKHLKKGTAAPFFLKDGKRPYSAGNTVRQPVLAQTLQRLASAGVDDFYHGQIADLIAEDMEQNGGLVHLDDLAQIPWPVERRPLSCRFQNLRVLTMPPPGAGRALVEILQILDHLPERLRRPDTPRAAVALAEVILRAYLDRRDRPFDPTYFNQETDKVVLSSEYAERVARRIERQLKRKPRSAKSGQNSDTGQTRSGTGSDGKLPASGGRSGTGRNNPSADGAATGNRQIDAQREARGETTHLSVMDRAGNVVSLTQSIERVFGSFAASPELGFLYNNYMSAFEYQDIKHPHYLRPNAVPWASVAPTIVFRSRRPWLAIGSPGSDRIAPSIAQVMIRLNGQSPYEAVAAPRLHCLLDRTVSLEASRMRNDIPQWLRDYGFEVRERDAFSFYHGCIQLVLHQHGEFLGVADPRRDGSAAGPT